MFEKIKTSKKIGELPVYDIEVENNSHNFYANDFLVHNCVYSYISWQTLYFKVYYPSYFYAAMLNMEKDTEKIQEIIDDAKYNSIEILPLSIHESEYHCKAVGDDAIRLGYQLVKGMGGAVETELKNLELHKCSTIDEILKKPFKKINSSLLQSLIDLGCFDELGVDRDLVVILKNLYKEPKIEKWFSRKRNPLEEKTMPDILKEYFEVEKIMEAVEKYKGVPIEEEPHIKFVSDIAKTLQVNIPDEELHQKNLRKSTSQKEIELLGFSVTEDKEFMSFITTIRRQGFFSLTECKEDPMNNQCYFKAVKIDEAKTKTGKTYWVVTANDGKKEYKLKMWRILDQSLRAGSICIGAVEYDEKWGFTLQSCAATDI